MAPPLRQEGGRHEDERRPDDQRGDDLTSAEPLDTGARDAVFVCPLRAFRVWSLLVSFDALGEMLAALLQAVGTDLALQLTQEEAHDGEGVPDVCLAQARVELDHRAVYLPAHLQLEDLCQGQ